MSHSIQKDGNNYADTILITVNEEGILSLAETNVVLMSASLADWEQSTDRERLLTNSLCFLEYVSKNFFLIYTRLYTG